MFFRFGYPLATFGPFAALALESWWERPRSENSNRGGQAMKEWGFGWPPTKIPLGAVASSYVPVASLCSFQHLPACWAAFQRQGFTESK